MRAIWKGAISFGLVNVPIGLYTATRSDDLKFHMLRRKDLSPISYKRVAKADDKEVAWEDIVKGYEYEKGKYVVLKDEDFRRVDVEATQTVDIVDFVKLDDINPMYFSKPYYMAPQKGGEKAYALLREVLTRENVVGIAKVVIKTRQHLAAVKAQKEVLVLEIMHFRDELVDACDLEIPSKVRLGKRELQMAEELVDTMTVPWEPEKYTDDYREGLLKVIEQKVEAGEEELPPPPKRAKQPKVVNLVDVLKESLAQGRPAERGRPERKAARRPARKKTRKSKRRPSTRQRTSR